MRWLLILVLSARVWGTCSPTAPNKAGGTLTTATSAAVTVTIANTTDLVVFSVWCVAACTINSVQDGAANAYTKSTNSPGTTNTAGQPYMYYRLAANASGSVTITAQFSASAQHQVGAIDFALGAGCTAVFDTDLFGTGLGTTINTPSLTVAGAGELLYSFAATSGTISSGNSPWTQGTIYATTTNADEYILSGSAGATAVNYTGTSSDWSAGAMAFILSSGGAAACNHALALLGAGCS